MEIKPATGIDSLVFGMTMNDAQKLFGKPEEEVKLDDIEDFQATVWHYWQNGVSLFFDENDNQHFFSVEIDNLDTELWGHKIFTLKEKQIIELFKIKGFEQSDAEMHEWGEKRVTFDALNIDFYFEKNNLVSINFGKI